MKRRDLFLHVRFGRELLIVIHVLASSAGPGIDTRQDARLRVDKPAPQE